VWKDCRRSYSKCRRITFYTLSTGSFSQYVLKLINLSHVLKGRISIGELENLPNRYIQVVYKEYVETLKNRDKQDAAAGEELEEQLEDAFAGG
jgi:hypothetical protein